jgi:hypothetical protein
MTFVGQARKETGASVSAERTVGLVLAGRTPSCVLAFKPASRTQQRYLSPFSSAHLPRPLMIPPLP